MNDPQNHQQTYYHHHPQHVLPPAQHFHQHYNYTNQSFNGFYSSTTTFGTQHVSNGNDMFTNTISPNFPTYGSPPNNTAVDYTTPHMQSFVQTDWASPTSQFQSPEATLEASTQVSETSVIISRHNSVSSEPADRSVSLPTSTELSLESQNQRMERVPSLLSDESADTFLIKCGYCPKKFAKEKVADHRNQCLKARRYSCVYCPKRFVKRSGLKQHILTHKDKIGHICNTCLKKIIRPSRAVHYGRGSERSYTRCEKCALKYLKYIPSKPSRGKRFTATDWMPETNDEESNIPLIDLTETSDVESLPEPRSNSSSAAFFAHFGHESDDLMIPTPEGFIGDLGEPLNSVIDTFVGYT